MPVRKSRKPKPKRFRIAFSFAGEKRSFIAKVVEILKEPFGKPAILYDKYHEAEFARSDLSLYLPQLYHDQSDLVVVVICRDYRKKSWCGLEWKAIHALLQGRKDKEVMLCRFGRASLRGLFSGAGYSELDDKSPRETADLILERLALNEGKARDYYHRKAGAVDKRATTPNNLPLLPSFFGREDELKAIGVALDPDRQSWGVLVRGQGGIGKTSLAIQAALRTPRGHFDRIIFLSAKERDMTPDGTRKLDGFILPTFSDMLCEIGRLVGNLKLPKYRRKEFPKLVREMLHSTKVLLVLDNVETLSDDDQDKLLTFVSRLPRGCKAIVTTRLKREGDGRLIELARLKQKAALAYLKELEKGRPLLKRTARGERINLYEETGGNPLLMRWVVGNLGRRRCQTMAHTIEYLKKAPGGNDALDFVLHDLVQDLSPNELKAIIGLSGLPGGVDARTLAQRTSLSITAAITVLDDLSDRGLIEANSTRQLFGVLPVVVAYLTRENKSAVMTRRRSAKRGGVRR